MLRFSATIRKIKSRTPFDVGILPTRALALAISREYRRLGLAGTELAQAQCSTIRLKLLKIGALIRITVRKVWISLVGGYPRRAVPASP